ncbi:hypothetical protein BBI09_18770 [Stutzerimonas xanthomarina]|uniref:tetratricopeptide repeat protein n=1 Tax=Stutzerimonas nitrititolerans TaxID=2482751 RepID=UPI0008258369|nr:tetratricopeptide repeat protein [Stutzerimonas nitrititolerans]OCX11853.1 hypothetical protein BBI09_18770 [Stutzerimonas xanthomarina]
MQRLSLALFLTLLAGCSSMIPQSSLTALQNDADRAYAAGNFEQAGTLYRRLSQSLPTDAGVRYQLGNSLARQGDTRGAIASYREALVRDPQHARAWHNLLQVQLREALFTAGEMHQVLNPQQPMADRALGLGERLLDVMQQPGQAGGQEP